MELESKIPKLLHLALTGVPGAGKTTYIKKLAKCLSQNRIPCYGFVTEEVRDSNHKRIGFDVVTLDGKRGALARVNTSKANLGSPPTSSCLVGEYRVDVKSFEAVVLPLLSAEVPESSVIVIDEIGKMQIFSSKFSQKIRELLSSSNHRFLVALPVAKMNLDPLVAEIKMREDFMIKNITKQNRDDAVIFKNLLRYFDIQKNIRFLYNKSLLKDS